MCRMFIQPFLCILFTSLTPTHFCLDMWVNFVKKKPLMGHELKAHVPGCAALLLFTDKLSQVKCSEVKKKKRGLNLEKEEGV